MTRGALVVGCCCSTALAAAVYYHWHTTRTNRIRRLWVPLPDGGQLEVLVFTPTSCEQAIQVQCPVLEILY
jgi:hypothetical protein